MKKFIRNLSNTTFDSLKNELKRTDVNNNQIYYINIKEDDELAIIYYNDIPTTDITRDPDAEQLEKNCRSYIIEKSSLRPIGSQFNKIIYNTDAKEFLADKEWNKVSVQKCYEGARILLFNHKDKWYVSTRRCLDARESKWVVNKSFREMFDEAMDGLFTFDELDKNLCYHFVLVHYKNKTIVNYNYLGKYHKYLYHILTTEKYTLKEVDVKINDNVNYIEDEQFDNIDSLLKKLDEIDNMNKAGKRITTEGYILRVYEGKVHNSPFTVLKLQTEIYQTLMKMKPNNSNINQNYLELYQKDKLKDFAPYFTRFSTDIIKRLHISMKTISKELLDIYHNTRQKKNPELYNSLKEQQKKVLYGLHGLYMDNRKQEFTNKTDDLSRELSKSINVHDVYHYLKCLPYNELRQLYYERTVLIDEGVNIKYINKNCIPTKAQCSLMFRN